MQLPILSCAALETCQDQTTSYDLSKKKLLTSYNFFLLKTLTSTHRATLEIHTKGSNMNLVQKIFKIFFKIFAMEDQNSLALVLYMESLSITIFAIFPLLDHLRVKLAITASLRCRLSPLHTPYSF